MTQILVLLVALAAVVWRAFIRKMTVAEWSLVAFVGLNIFIVQLQMFVGENGKLDWILRYHQAAIVFLYGWAAWGVVSLADRLPGRWRTAMFLLAGLWFAGSAGTSLWRIAKQEFVDSNRSARARAAEWAAEIVRKDYDGPALDAGRFFTLQDYHSSRRPIILSDGAYLVTLLGGRWVTTSPDIKRHERPDYALLPKDRPPPKGMEILAETEIGKKKRSFVLYRARKFWQAP